MYDNLLGKQIERERRFIHEGIREENKEIQKLSNKCYFSSSLWGKSFRQENFLKLRLAFDSSYSDARKKLQGKRVPERLEAIRSFLDVAELLKAKKSKANQSNEADELDNLFNLITHITITAVLDNSMTPYANNLKDNKCRNPESRKKEDVSELENSIGKEILFQTRLYLLSSVAEGWVNAVHRYASQKGMANQYYHHYNTDRLVEDLLSTAAIKKADLDSDPESYTDSQRRIINSNARIADAFKLFTWNNETCKFLGQWALHTLLSESTGINAFVLKQSSKSVYAVDSKGQPRKNKDGNLILQNKFCQMLYPIPVYAEAWKMITDPNDLEEEELDSKYYHFMSRVPMIIPPCNINNEKIGGWLSSSNDQPLRTSKGNILFSDQHLDFYNAQAQVPFKLNKWIHQLLCQFRDAGNYERPIKLGSFKFHKIQPVASVCSRLEFTRPKGWEDYTKDQQKKYAIDKVGEDAWNEATKETQEAHRHQEELKRKGIASAQTILMADKLIHDDEFFIPVRFDFRGRVVIRTAHVHYQAPDHGKALLKFANSVAVDKDTKHWLLIQLANSYGSKLDKQSFSCRKNTMLQPLQQEQLKAVSTMLDDDGSFSDGLAVLKYVDANGGDCFQFAAACREYWELFIAHIKTTTDLIVTVDCSTSGQQIASGWLKNRELAIQTNVINNSSGAPADLYGAVFERMLVKMEDDGKAFNRHSLERMEKLGFGRAICKAAIQGAQYGSGAKTQRQAIVDKINELEEKGQLTLLKETPSGLNEVEEFQKYFLVALEEVCKLSILNDWFHELAEACHDKGLDQIVVPTPNGTELKIKYTPSTDKRVKTFGYGETRVRQTLINKVLEPEQLTDAHKKERFGNWRTSLCPNVTHAMDANLIAMALHDFPFEFTSCHDSLGCHASSRMNDLRKRLLESFTVIADYPIFQQIIDRNDLAHAIQLPPIDEWQGYHDEIKASQYFTS